MIAMVVAAAAAASLPSADLTSLVRFDEQCGPSPAFDQMLGSMLSTKADGTVRKGKLLVPLALRHAFGRVRLRRPQGDSDMWLISVSVSAQWRGLRLRGIEQYVVPNTGVGGFSLYFAEPAQRVRAVMKQLGYELTPGRVIDVAKDGMSVYADLTIVPTGTVFSCGT